MSKRRWLSVGAIAAFALASCSDCDDDGSCLPYGTYVDLNEALGSASARICLDDDCSTLLPGEEQGNVQTGFYRDDWEDGRELRLTIEVFDESGAVIDSLTETRTMNSGDCSCGVLFYGWQNDRLHRID